METTLWSPSWSPSASQKTTFSPTVMWFCPTLCIWLFRPCISLSIHKRHDNNHHVLAVMATRLLLMRLCFQMAGNETGTVLWCSEIGRLDLLMILAMLYKSLNHTQTLQTCWDIHSLLTVRTFLFEMFYISDPPAECKSARGAPLRHPDKNVYSHTPWNKVNGGKTSENLRLALSHGCVQ